MTCTQLVFAKPATRLLENRPTIKRGFFRGAGHDAKCARRYPTEGTHFRNLIAIIAFARSRAATYRLTLSMLGMGSIEPTKE